MQEQVLRWMERGDGPHAVQVVIELMVLCVVVWFGWRVAVRPMLTEMRQEWRVWKRWKHMCGGKKGQKKSAPAGGQARTAE